MTPHPRVTPDAQGKYWEDFLVFDGEVGLRRRFGRDAQQRIRDNGGYVVRYETDGNGNVIEPSAKPLFDMSLTRQARQEALEKFHQEAFAPGSDPD